MDFTDFIFHEILQLRSWGVVHGVFSNHFITNFPQNVPMKKFWESVNTWQRYGKSLRLTFGATL